MKKKFNYVFEQLYPGSGDFNTLQDMIKSKVPSNYDGTLFSIIINDIKLYPEDITIRKWTK